MTRALATLSLAILLGSVTVTAQPPSPAPAGTWKLTLRSDQTPILLLVAFSKAEGKWIGDLIDATAKFRKEPTFGEVAVNGDHLKFTLVIEGQTLVSFDGIVAKDGKKIAGSMIQGGGPLELTELRPSTLKKLTDSFEIMKESLQQTDEPQAAFEAASVVLGQAAAKKLPAEEARGIVDRVTRLAAGQGPRWERNVTLRIAGLVAVQEGYAEIALAQARRAERMLTDDDDATTRMEVLDTLGRTLAKAGKADEAKKYQSQISKLEARDYLDYLKQNPPIKSEPFVGRKSKSDRVVLVEIFSNSELPPSAGFDLAGDTLSKTYKPSEVIVLTHHFHLRDMADPLTSLNIKDRLEGYIQGIQRGRFGMVAGKAVVAAKETTNSSAAKEIYTAFRESVNEELEKPAGAKLALTVTPDAKGFAAKASVSALEAPGEQVFLRFAVVENRVRYSGGNGIRYHHHIVRSMPGGKGFALNAKSAEQTVTVNADELREKLVKSLEEYAKDGAEFPRADKPLALTNLKIVAFIQNDATGEVLTAAIADLPGK